MHAGGQYLLRFTVRQMFFRLCYRVRISGCGGVGLRGIHSGAGFFSCGIDCGEMARTNSLSIRICVGGGRLDKPVSSPIMKPAAAVIRAHTAHDRQTVLNDRATVPAAEASSAAAVCGTSISLLSRSSSTSSLCRSSIVLSSSRSNVSGASADAGGGDAGSRIVSVFMFGA